jgi:transcriptional regulator with XRE-family HTH domain
MTTEGWAHRRKEVGRRVTALIEGKRMSFGGAARATGISKTGLYKIADGTSDPRLSSLYRIADAFGVDVADLLDTPDPVSGDGR